jgi:hypothetical protein
MKLKTRPMDARGRELPREADAGSIAAAAINRERRVTAALLLLPK